MALSSSASNAHRRLLIMVSRALSVRSEASLHDQRPPR